MKGGVRTGRVVEEGGVVTGRVVEGGGEDIPLSGAVATLGVGSASWKNDCRLPRLEAGQGAGLPSSPPLNMLR